MGIRNVISKLAGKIKSEYNYFKAGVRETIKNDPKAKAERERYRNAAIKSGLLDPEKEARIRRNGGI